MRTFHKIQIQSDRKEAYATFQLEEKHRCGLQIRASDSCNTTERIAEFSIDTDRLPGP
ncbi:MAG: hypothetical protein ACOC32_02820 [Nanoarchaeota archaeon]